MNLTLTGLTHTWPDDIDILLASPTPSTNAFLMSDAGGMNDVDAINLTLDDEAATQLPDENLITTGSYRPANYAGPGTDEFPSPAPAPSGQVNLSAFDGTAPNGTWNLWVVDDEINDLGSITSWSLTITTWRRHRRRHLRHRRLHHHRLRHLRHLRHLHLRHLRLRRHLRLHLRHRRLRHRRLRHRHRHLRLRLRRHLRPPAAAFRASSACGSVSQGSGSAGPTAASAGCVAFAPGERSAAASSARARGRAPSGVQASG